MLNEKPPETLAYDKLTELKRQFSDCVKTSTSVQLRIKANCRRLTEDGGLKEADLIHKAMFGKADHPMGEVALIQNAPMLQVLEIADAHKNAIRKEMVKAARNLPEFDFVEKVRGLGESTLAEIIAETGPIAAYETHSALWKRLGLAVINGERQRRLKDKDAALMHGYAPHRRALIYVMGDCLIRAGSEYKAVYEARKEYELARTDEGAPKSLGHAHNRAKRYMEKRVIRDLWKHAARRPLMARPLLGLTSIADAAQTFEAECAA